MMSSWQLTRPAPPAGGDGVHARLDAEVGEARALLVAVGRGHAQRAVGERRAAADRREVVAGGGHDDDALGARVVDRLLGARISAPVISSACTPGSAPRRRDVDRRRRDRPTSGCRRRSPRKEPPSAVRTVTASSGVGRGPATPIGRRSRRRAACVGMPLPAGSPALRADLRRARSAGVVGQPLIGRPAGEASVGARRAGPDRERLGAPDEYGGLAVHSWSRCSPRQRSLGAACAAAGTASASVRAIAAPAMWERRLMGAATHARAETGGDVPTSQSVGLRSCLPDELRGATLPHTNGKCLQKAKLLT